MKPIKLLVTLLVACAFIVSTRPTFAGDVESIVQIQPMHVGDSQVLTFDTIKTSQIGDTAVLDATPLSKDRLLVSAKRAGRSTVTVNDAKGRHVTQISVLPGYLGTTDGTIVFNPVVDPRAGEVVNIEVGSSIFVKADSVSPDTNTSQSIRIQSAVEGYVEIAGRAEGDGAVTIVSDGHSKLVVVIVTRHHFSRSETIRYAEQLTKLLADRFPDVVVSVSGEDTIVLSGFCHIDARARIVSPDRLAPPLNGSDPLSFAYQVVPYGIYVVDRVGRDGLAEQPKLRLIK